MAGKKSISEIKSSVKFDMKSIAKKVGNKLGMQVGFHDPEVWLDTGNYLLNYCISNDFYRGIPLEGKVTMIAGESGSGKSLFGSGMAVKDALDKGVLVNFIDTEDAATEEWIRKAGVDTEHPNYARIQKNSMSEILQYISDMCKNYNDAFEGVDESEQPGMLFVLDSFSAMYSEMEEKQYESAEFQMTDGMRKAIDNAKFVNACLSKCASKKIGFIFVNHVSTNMDMYAAPTISGGKKAIFLASIVIQMDKNKLSEFEVKGKSTASTSEDREQVGIKTSFKVQKTRFTQPFQGGKIFVPYNGGVQRYSGLFDFFRDKKLIKDGEKANTYKYVSCITGDEIFCEMKKNITDEMWDKVMQDFMEGQKQSLFGNNKSEYKEPTIEETLDSIISADAE